MMIDTLRLTVEEALGLLERKEVSGSELHRAYLGAVSERDGELHCYLRGRGRPESPQKARRATASRSRSRT